MSHIIFLHGPSSSGKSTIALELQARIALPFWHISIDHFRDSGILPMKRFRNGDFSWPDAKAAFFDGFHQSLKAYADAGNNLILEHILDVDGWLETPCDAFKDHDVLFVGVHCPLELLVDREIKRGDRPIGSARRDYDTVHLGKTYDVEVSSADELDASIDRIITAWQSVRRSSSFGCAAFN